MRTRTRWILLLLLPVFAGADEPREPVANPTDITVESPLDELLRIQQQARAMDAPATRRQLRERHSINLTDEPLSGALEKFAEITHMPFRLDDSALAAEGIATDTPVTLQMIRPQRVIDLLSRMLEPIHLTWRQEGRTVVVTTGTRARKILELRAYPISRLLRLAEQREAKLPAALTVAGIPPPRGRTIAEIGPGLVRVLQEAIDVSWKDRGGDGGQASVVNDTLLVHQSFGVHREVAALLRAIELALLRPPGSSPLLTMESDEDAATFTRLQCTLDKELDFTFVDLPLNDVAIWLGDQIEEDFVIDRGSLTDEGIASDSPVTFSGQLPIRTALQRILRPLDLTFELRNHSVLITTKRMFAEHQQSVVFDVADFLNAGLQLQEIIRVIEESTSGPWMRSGSGTISEFPGGLLVVRHVADVQVEIALLLHDLRNSIREGGPMPPRPKVAELETRFHRAKSKQEAEALDLLIQTFVAPTTWDVSGGRGQLRTAEDRLIIRQTKTIHDQIDRFLREYQQARPISPPTK